MIGSKAAAPSSPSSAFRMTPPAGSSPLTSSSKRKTLSAISALCTPWSPLTASPSAFTAIATASFSATMPTGPWPNNSRVNSAPPIGDGLWKSPASSKSPAYSPQAKGPIERIWRTCQDRLVSELRLAQACDLDSANQVLARFCADYNHRFAVPAREAQRDFRALPPRFDLARCLSFRYQRVVGPDHVIPFGARSIALPALPSKRGYAGHTVELSHRLDGRLLVSYRNVLLLSLPWPLPVRELSHPRPAPRITAQKPKTPMPRIYNLGGRPAVAAVT